jgi:hypothetical protein
MTRMMQGNNLYIGKCLCIDWDLYFDDFLKIALNHTRVLIQTVEEKTRRKTEAFYQESASGNVHIALKFEHPVTVLDAFMIRAWLGDDETRLRLDLARYFKTGSLHEMNRCFQDKIKIKNGQATLKSAGPWIRFDIEIELPGITTREAHALISNLQEERRHTHGKNR